MADSRPGPEDEREATLLARAHGMTEAEYGLLLDRLGRKPSLTELAMVAAMWSEHCSYKSSRALLRTLPSTGERVLRGPGENAGVVDIGDGQAVVFKMESHNHPSFIEPYQGAATGVGGICRDIFAMGARPIALADCLRFGRPEHPRTRYLVHRVVEGIGDYANAFGVPTIAGDVAFDASHDGNILVNVLCLGLLDAPRVYSGTAAGAGNSVMYVGARTGRDGIHGATMASAAFGERVAEKRPAVQVGDPFAGKSLLEACLELMQGDCLVGVQDMGAAGLTSASVEMAARAGTGMDLELERVPVRERDMTPYEIMLSESQERMLLVVRAGREHEVFAACERWDIEAAVIGRVTDNGRIRVRMHGRVYAELPADLLAGGVECERPCSRPAYLDDCAELALPEQPRDPARLAEHLAEALLALLSAPGITAKEWVYSQYDYNVGHATVVRPGSADAGVVRVFAPERTGEPAREKAVAVAAGCNNRHVYLAPYEGTALAVAEAYANLLAAGATPLAVTNCLNFGDPEQPEVMWQLAESVRGLGDACRALGMPVVSGNVSLYNQTGAQAIKPTPMVAMIGLLGDPAHHLRMGFVAPGQVIAVIGQLSGSLAGSEYLARIHGREAGIPASFEPSRHKPVFAAMRAMHRQRLLCSAHDISDGGLAVAVAECALLAEHRLSVSLDLGRPAGRVDELLFGEAPARLVVALERTHLATAEQLATREGAPFTIIGTTREPAHGSAPEMVITLGETRVALPLSDLRHAYTTGFSSLVEQTSAGAT